MLVRPIGALLEARLREAGARGGVLVLDEVQKLPGWSESVKRLWDRDTAEHWARISSTARWARASN